MRRLRDGDRKPFPAHQIRLSVGRRAVLYRNLHPVPGNIKEVEKELGISYPTVRSKLDGVIKKLGYETGADEQAAKREEILKALENGEITAEQALAQLK